MQPRRPKQQQTVALQPPSSHTHVVNIRVKHHQRQIPGRMPNPQMAVVATHPRPLHPIVVPTCKIVFQNASILQLQQQWGGMRQRSRVSQELQHHPSIMRGKMDEEHRVQCPYNGYAVVYWCIVHVLLFSYMVLPTYPGHTMAHPHMCPPPQHHPPHPPHAGVVHWCQ